MVEKAEEEGKPPVEQKSKKVKIERPAEIPEGAVNLTNVPKWKLSYQWKRGIVIVMIIAGISYLVWKYWYVKDTADVVAASPDGF